MNEVRRVLVLDDEPQILRTLRVILRDAGFEVDTAARPSRRLPPRPPARPPDAAIVDLILPDRQLLPGGAVAVLASWPAAGPALALLQLLLCPANAAFSGRLLLGILDPAYELVAR
jgi:DNA-binding NtrC family response regulator